MPPSIPKNMTEWEFGEGRYILGEGSRPQVAMLVRERSPMIRYLGDTSVEVRPGMFQLKNCLIIVLLLRMGRHVRKIYPVWWDFYAPGGKEAFQAMQKQQVVGIYLHGDSGERVRSFALENPWQEFFRNAIDFATELPPWNRVEFDRVRQVAMGRAGSLERLWRELGGEEPQWPSGPAEDRA